MPTKRRAGGANVTGTAPPLLIAPIPDAVIVALIVDRFDLVAARRLCGLSRAWRDACRRRCGVIQRSLIDALPRARLVMSAPKRDMLLGDPHRPMRLAYRAPGFTLLVRYLPTSSELMTVVPSGDDQVTTVHVTSTSEAAARNVIAASAVRIDEWRWDSGGGTVEPPPSVAVVEAWHMLMAPFDRRVVQLATVGGGSELSRDAAHCLFWLRTFIDERWRDIDAWFALQLSYRIDRILMAHVFRDDDNNE